MKLTVFPVKIAKSIVLLVTTPIDRSLYVQAAGWLLRREKDAEQVAFLSWAGDEPRLGIPGGALSVNGAMALTAWLATDNGVPAGEAWSFPLSGGPVELPCAVTPVHTCCLITVTMPQPEVMAHPLPGSDMTLPLVRFPGVSHMIVPAGTLQRTAAADLLRRRSGLPDAPLAGLLLWDEQTHTLDPLLYDRASGSITRRQSCGSAAAAVGAYLAGRADESVSVKMPGGVMAVTRQEGGALTVTAPAEVGHRRTVDLVF